VRIANCSGFWGDRLSAAEEMVRGGPIDVLTGDYLAELTMALLHRGRAKSRGGFVPTFLKQMESVLGECMDKKIKVVSNAGGLDPGALAEELDALAKRLGLAPKIAFIDGDDLVPRLDELRAAGERFVHLDRKVELGARPVVTANAYLGGWAIREALERGADVVVCGRVTDAALVVGPSAWRFGWRRDDWDRLAGAVAAGHVIECSAQATGGNYSFFDEVPSLLKVGFPLVEMEADGSFVVTKHPGTGGLVSVGTVTAQLLYEIDSPRYANPDVVACFDSLRLEQIGADRVRVSGARGEPPPTTLKVSANLDGGWRNSMTVLLGGLDLERKAQLVEEALFDALGGRAQFDRVDTQLQRLDDGTLAYLKITVFSADKSRVGRRFSSMVVAQALSTIPGFSSRTPPDDASPSLVYWPTLVGADKIAARVHFGGETLEVPQLVAGARAFSPSPSSPTVAAPPDGTVRVPLGKLFGTRSGDKGGNANLGVWAKTDRNWAWLRAFLTTERLKQLLPACAPFAIDRWELENLRALNFLVRGVLGDGVAASSATDPQAKTLGEQLRAQTIAVDAGLDGLP
jgi:hypothetical protein